jgi:phosphohistidine phosphatase
MFIYVVRHAWAEQRDPGRWPDDALRPLTPQGRQRFKKVAKALVKRGFAPARMATSPLVRCQQTAAILLHYLPKSTTLVELEALAPGSDLNALVAWTRERADGDVAWIGHAPDVDELTAALIGGSAAIHFAKGAVAAVRFDDIAQNHGALEWLVTARLLGC